MSLHSFLLILVSKSIFVKLKEIDPVGILCTSKPHLPMWFHVGMIWNWLVQVWLRIYFHLCRMNQMLLNVIYLLHFSLPMDKGLVLNVFSVLNQTIMQLGNMKLAFILHCRSDDYMASLAKVHCLRRNWVSNWNVWFGIAVTKNDYADAFSCVCVRVCVFNNFFGQITLYHCIFINIHSLLLFLYFKSTLIFSTTQKWEKWVYIYKDRIEWMLSS